MTMAMMMMWLTVIPNITIPVGKQDHGIQNFKMQGGNISEEKHKNNFTFKSVPFEHLYFPNLTSPSIPLKVPLRVFSGLMS